MDHEFIPGELGILTLFFCCCLDNQCENILAIQSFDIFYFLGHCIFESRV